MAIGPIDRKGTKDIVDAVNASSAGGASEETLEDIRDGIADLPTEQGLTNDELRAADVETNDSSANTKLTSIDGHVQGLLTNDQLRAAPVPVTDTTNTTAIQNVDTHVQELLTDTELRATPVPVSGTVTVNSGSGVATSANQNVEIGLLGTATTSPPTAGTGMLGWLRGIYDKVSALPTTAPQTDALTNTQLRASDVPVSGPVTNTQLRATSLEVNARPYAANTVYNLSGAQSIGAVIIPATEAKGQFLTVKNSVLGTGNTGIAFQMSEDGVTWYNVPSILLSNGTATFTTQTGNLGGTAAVYGFSVIGRYYRGTLIAAQSAGTTTTSVTEYATVPALYAVAQNVTGSVTLAGTVVSGSAQLVTDRGSTPTLATVASLATTQSFSVSNAAYKLRTVFNESTSILYLAYGGTATITAYTVQIAPGGFFIEDKYTGVMSGIWATANGNARITSVV